MNRIDNLIGIKPIEGFFFFIVLVITVGLLATPYYPYAILPGISLVFLFLLIKFPQFGYYIIVFLIPFEVYRTLSSSYQFLTISKFVGLLVVIIISLYLLLQKKIPFNLKSNLWPWFAIFFSIGIFSTLLSEYKLTSFNNLRQLLVAYIFYALTMVFISKKDFQKTLPVVLMVSVSISSILSIIGYVFNVPLFAMNVESELTKRGIGATHDPNIFSAMIIFSLPIFIYWFFSSRTFLQKILAFLLFLLNVTAIILTYSRGGAMVLLVVLILLVISNIHRFRPKYVGFVALLMTVAIAAIIIFIPTTYWKRQKSVTDTTDYSIARRISYIYFALEDFKENPIIGSGPGVFKEKYATSKYAPEYGDYKDFERYAHNSYLEVLIGTGLIGFIVFLIILLLVLENFYATKKRLRLNGEEKMVFLIEMYRLSFVSLLIYFFMLSIPYHKYFWVSLALSQVALRLSQEVPEIENGENTYHSK